jgi:hypothetical protein
MALTRSPASVMTNRPERVRHPGERIAKVDTECGLAVGAGWHEAVTAAVAEGDRADGLDVAVLERLNQPAEELLLGG